ncbi:hypothetical protein PT2222_120339 [Paraburkholderia tropica]
MAFSWEIQDQYFFHSDNFLSLIFRKRS